MELLGGDVYFYQYTYHELKDGFLNCCCMAFPRPRHTENASQWWGTSHVFIIVIQFFIPDQPPHYLNNRWLQLGL